MDKRTRIAIILGTGSNAAFLENADRVHHWEGERHGEKNVIIDTEWGAFGDNGKTIIYSKSISFSFFPTKNAININYSYNSKNFLSSFPLKGKLDFIKTPFDVQVDNWSLLKKSFT